jgi:hypothetical protein
MAHGRHSYVEFYPGDWIGGTARLPRLHRSVYHDICVYIWDKAAPCPAAELRLILGDLPDWERYVEELIAAGKLTRNPDGGIVNPKALELAEKARGLWQKKSQGGRKGAEIANGTGSPHGTPDGSPAETPPPLPTQNQNQNQNQNQPKKETPIGVSPASRIRAAAECLSSTWKPSDAERDLATALGLSPADLERESRKFLFYYTAGKGSGRRSTPRGWRQTWANWISKAVERLPDFAESQPVTAKREWRWRWPPSLGDANREQIGARLAGWKFGTAKTLAGQCEIDIDGEQLIFRAPNKMVRDMLQQQHDDELRRAWGGPITVSLHSDKRAA